MQMVCSFIECFTLFNRWHNWNWMEIQTFRLITGFQIEWHLINDFNSCTEYLPRFRHISINVTYPAACIFCLLLWTAMLNKTGYWISIWEIWFSKLRFEKTKTNLWILCLMYKYVYIILRKQCYKTKAVINWVVSTSPVFC